MIHGFFIGIFYYVLLIFNFLFSEQPVADIVVPSEVSAGQRFVVTVTLNKSDLYGFARYHQKLPHGLKAYPGQLTNCDFSFKNHQVKFIWLNLPEDEQFSVSYYLEVDERVKGSFNLGGAFSFIVENQRGNLKIDNQSIYITASPDVAHSIDINDFKEDFDYSKLPREDLLACVRQKPYLDETSQKYIVNLLVYKKDKERFAKIEENLPSGITAVADESKDPIFSFKDEMAKFIWMDLPSEPYFVISYDLMSKTLADNIVKGNFSYIENDQTRIIEIIERGDIDLTNTDLDYLKSVIESSYEQIAKANSQMKFEDPKKNNLPKQPIAKKPVKVKVKGEVSSVPSPKLDPEEGVYYKVQLAAGHKVVNISKYFRKYKLKHEVRSEQHDGWFKYSIGAFYTYKHARDYRVYIWESTPIDDAFVSAYNSGMRITVQEALMIANHKWYK